MTQGTGVGAAAAAAMQTKAHSLIEYAAHSCSFDRETCASCQGCLQPLSAFSDSPYLHEWQLLAAITSDSGII